MKNLLKAIAFAIVVLTCYTCSVEPAETVQEESVILQEDQNAFVADEAETNCTSQDPQAQLTNNSLLDADIEVFDHFGILMTHAYGVTAGTVSPVLSFPDGVTTFVISTSQSSKTITIDMSDCTIYEVEINENNQLNTDAPTAL